MSLTNSVPRFCRSFPEKHIRRRQYRTPDEGDVNTNPWIQPRVSKPITDEDDDANDDAQPDENEQVVKLRKLSDSPYRRSSRNCSLCFHYNGMLYLNFVGQREMVVVEQPWLEVVATLPEAIQRRVYGLN